jgi:hypothetical protein
MGNLGGQARGQAALEAALTLPLILLAALGIVQLALLQQARLLLGAAAFGAVRSGVVWGGDPQRMRDAARFTLLPLLEAPTDGAALTRAFEKSEQLDAALAPYFREGWIRVEVLAPTSADFPRDETGRVLPELDPDALRPGKPPPEVRVRVRILCPLRLPWVNKAVFLGYFAARAHQILSFPLVGTPFSPEGLDANARGVTLEDGLPLVSHEELELLWAISKRGLGEGLPRYFIPLSATYRLRLQSSFQARFLPSGLGQ